MSRADQAISWRLGLDTEFKHRNTWCLLHSLCAKEAKSNSRFWTMEESFTCPAIRSFVCILIQQASTSLLVQIFSPSNLHYHRRWRSTARPIVHDTCARPTRNARKCKPASYQVSSASSDENVPVPWVIWDVTAVHGSKVVLSLSCPERNLTNLYLHGSATKVVDIQALAGEVSLAIFSAALRPLSCWRCVTDEVQEADDKAF
jgi:hypothetical protein